MARIYDISQTLRDVLPVWPDDTAYDIAKKWAISPDCPVNVSRITMSSHSGTHADAPSHYDTDGIDSDGLDLGRYMGECVVIDARGANGAVTPGDIADQLPENVERVLLRTYQSFPHDCWESDFTAVVAETIHLIADRGALLIGVDAPSLDPETSKTMDAHMAVKERGLGILEGLVLDDVPPGRYELIALPLKMAASDAAPVRAILRELES